MRRRRWVNGLWAVCFIGCSPFSGDDTDGVPNEGQPPASANDAGGERGDGGLITAPPTCGDAVCDAPPKAACVDDHSYQSFTAACVEGACQYDPKPVACPESTSCVDGACVDTRARLSALAVSPGKLSFDPATLQYTVTVPAGTPSVEIKASVADAKVASISIDGGAKGSTSSVTSNAAFAAGSKARQVPIRVDTTYGTSKTYSVLFLHQGEQTTFATPVQTPYFGALTAISSDGSTILAGGFEGNIAATYVYRRNVVGIWNEWAPLIPPPNVSGGKYVPSFTLSGDGRFVVVGSPCDSSSSHGINGAEVTVDSLPCSGSVRVYRDNGGTWTQEAYLKASTAHDGDHFGATVAFSEDATTLVVGAYGDNQNAKGVDGASTGVQGLSVSGAAYIFRRSLSGTWTQEAYLKASNPDAGDYFGNAVAVSNAGVVAIGAPNEDGSSRGIGGSQDDNSFTNSGAVYTFRRESTGKWIQQAYIKASNANSFHGFGASITLSADGATLAVGATGDSSGAIGVNGDQGGNDATGSGAAYVFQRSNADSWAQTAYIKASNAEKSDSFGRALALSSDGSTLGVGSPNESSSATGLNGLQNNNDSSKSGAVYIFRRSGSSWSQTVYVKAATSQPSSNFGESISLSKDGTGLVVGAPAYSGQSRPIDPSGSVHVFAL